eukprot:1393975-Amorphochlora_amoeboformis.AAC.2
MEVGKGNMCSELLECWEPFGAWSGPWVRCRAVGCLIAFFCAYPRISFGRWYGWSLGGCWSGQPP